MLLDGCNMLIALRRPTRTRSRCRPRWNDDVSLRMTISHGVVDSLTIICAVCYHRCDPGRDICRVVGNCDIDVEQSRDRSQQSFSLTQRLVEHQAERKRGLDSYCRIDRLTATRSSRRSVP